MSDTTDANATAAAPDQRLLPRWLRCELWLWRIAIILLVVGHFVELRAREDGGTAASTLRVRKLIVEGAQGDARLQLEVRDGTPMLELYDSNDQLRSRLSQNAGGTGQLTFADHTGRVHAALAFDADAGTAALQLGQSGEDRALRVWSDRATRSAGFDILDEQKSTYLRLARYSEPPASVVEVAERPGQRRAFLQSYAETVSFGLCDNADKHRVSLEWRPDAGPRLFLRDASAAPRLILGLQDDTYPYLSLREPGSDLHAMAAVLDNGVPQFSLFDGDGQSRLSAYLRHGGEPAITVSSVVGQPTELIPPVRRSR